MDETLPQSSSRDLLVAALRAISRIALLVMIPLVFFFTTEGTWDLLKQRDDGGYSGGFFMAQAVAINRGRLNVPKGSIQGECFYRGSQCFGYMGVTPSLLRWPVLWLLQWLRSALTPLYLGVAVLLAYWASLRLLARSLVETHGPGRPRHLVLGYAIAGAIALGPGGTLLFLTRPAVFEEAAAWAVAFFLLALDRVWAWYRSRSLGALSLAVVFAAASANARPTTAIASGVLGLVVAYLSLFGDPQDARHAHEAEVGLRSPRTTKLLMPVVAICLALLPGVSAAGVSWGKFRTPIPDMRLNEQIPESPWWRDVLLANGDRTFGLVFAPTELVAYFRPDALTTQPAWPFFDFRFPNEPIWWVPPLHRGGVYVERAASLTSTMPLAWAVNVILVVWLSIVAWRPGTLSPQRTPWAQRLHLMALTRGQWVLLAGSLFSAASIAILTVTTIGITNRYLADFFATSVVGIALGHAVIVPFLERWRGLTAIAGLLALSLSGWSVLVTLSLTARLVFP